MISPAIQRPIAELLTVSLTLLLATVATVATTAAAELTLGPAQVVQAAGAHLLVTGFPAPSLVDWNEGERPEIQTH